MGQGGAARGTTAGGCDTGGRTVQEPSRTKLVAPPADPSRRGRMAARRHHDDLKGATAGRTAGTTPACPRRAAARLAAAAAAGTSGAAGTARAAGRSGAAAARSATHGAAAAHARARAGGAASTRPGAPAPVRAKLPPRAAVLPRVGNSPSLTPSWRRTASRP